MSKPKQDEKQNLATPEITKKNDSNASSPVLIFDMEMDDAESDEHS